MAAVFAEVDGDAVGPSGQGFAGEGKRAWFGVH
jgi:hypothetical protein